MSFGDVETEVAEVEFNSANLLFHLIDPVVSASVLFVGD